MELDEETASLLRYSPPGEYAYVRNPEDGMWGVGCFEPGKAMLIKVVAKGMDKTLAAALARILNARKELT